MRLVCDEAIVNKTHLHDNRKVSENLLRLSPINMLTNILMIFDYHTKNSSFTAGTSGWLLLLASYLARLNAVEPFAFRLH